MTVDMTLEEIRDLAYSALAANGCDDANASAVADTVARAERDGSHSHGLFRIPGYVASLRSGKVDGKASPAVESPAASVVAVDGRRGFAPLSLAEGLPVLAEAAGRTGVAAMKLVNIYHFAALWPEVEALSERDLVAVACTTTNPMVAPSGAREALLGTNPIAFSWPRPGRAPLVVDMATARIARGEVMLASREGHAVPGDAGLNAEGKPTTDPDAILKGGVQLPFGGYKGSAVALMVELLAAGLTGDHFSYRVGETDIGDGGPPGGGELVLAFDPSLLAGPDWAGHAEGFFSRLEALEGVRMPGARRHTNRLDEGPRAVNAELVDTIRGLVKD